MDAHASATAKADPEGYVTKSRELAEKKLASLYAGIIGVQSVGGVAKPTDPVSAVVMRLARRTIQKEKASDIAAAPKDQRLALINRLAAEYAQSVAWAAVCRAPGRLHIKTGGQPRGRAVRDARVSTEGQTLAAQESALHEAGAAKVFKEKISGAANHRAQLPSAAENHRRGRPCDRHKA